LPEKSIPRSEERANLIVIREGDGRFRHAVGTTEMGRAIIILLTADNVILLP
jgi:hypothetical protein